MMVIRLKKRSPAQPSQALPRRRPRGDEKSVVSSWHLLCCPSSARRGQSCTSLDHWSDRDLVFIALARAPMGVMTSCAPAFAVRLRRRIPAAPKVKRQIWAKSCPPHTSSPRNIDALTEASTLQDFRPRAAHTVIVTRLTDRV